jgi:hypothetical protein
MTIVQSKLEEFMGKAVCDFGATLHAALVVIGDKLGLYKAMAGAGPMTPGDLAQKTETAERYVREWLSAMAAGGYVEYDAKTKRYTLPEEQALALAQDDSPVFLPGAFQVALAATKAVPKIQDAFRSGEGVGWHEHDADLFEGTERFFRPGYHANLTVSWIPALDGVEAKLRKGARVADVGCGHGASTIVMAKAYPNSTFVGFDYHEPSIRWSRRRRSFRARATTSSPSSTACTTWATPSARRSTSVKRSHPTGRG